VQETIHHQSSFSGFNPHDLVRWCTNLKFYSTLEGSQFEGYILEVLCYEAIKIFVDRLPSCPDKDRVRSLIEEVSKANWDLGANFSHILATKYFVPRAEIGSCKRVIFDAMVKETWKAEVERGVSQFG